MRISLFFLLALVACGGNNEDDGKDAAPPPGSSPEESCGDTPPVITDFRITEAGDVTFGEGTAAETWPGLRLEVDISDDDGDITYYTMDVYWDETSDGQVDTSGEPNSTAQSTVSEVACGVKNNTVGMIIGVTGNPPFDTDVEFAVVVGDVRGNVSKAAVLEVHTPTQ